MSRSTSGDVEPEKRVRIGNAEAADAARQVDRMPSGEAWVEWRVNGV